MRGEDRVVVRALARCRGLGGACACGWERVEAKLRRRLSVGWKAVVSHRKLCLAPDTAVQWKDGDCKNASGSRLFPLDKETVCTACSPSAQPDGAGKENRESNTPRPPKNESRSGFVLRPRERNTLHRDWKALSEPQLCVESLGILRKYSLLMESERGVEGEAGGLFMLGDGLGARATKIFCDRLGTNKMCLHIRFLFLQAQ